MHNIRAETVDKRIVWVQKQLHLFYLEGRTFYLVSGQLNKTDYLVHNLNMLRVEKLLS